MGATCGIEPGWRCSCLLPGLETGLCRACFGTPQRSIIDGLDDWRGFQLTTILGMVSGTDDPDALVVSTNPEGMVIW